MEGMGGGRAERERHRIFREQKKMGTPEEGEEAKEEEKNHKMEQS